MSRLTDLIAQAKAKDPQLGADLESEFRVLSERRQFGLNFERHRPEAVELPDRPVRKGDKVRVLPPRGSTAKGDPTLWRVTGFDGAGEARTATLAPLADGGPDGDDQTRTIVVADLVVVAEFRDPIYPGLVSTGRVERGGDKPFHTVINAENYHALQTLLFTHKGRVDCIYIDPPYNTGAKDWKYNNDYVDGEDLYRHSKWLAFMERRLVLARELLNPADSVLIVTIDEKEYLRLGMLLDQVFPGVPRQMVTIVINPNGVARGAELARVEEYAYFLFLGSASPAALADPMLDQGTAPKEGVRWEWLMRGGSNSRRVDRPNLFYPIYVDEVAGRIAEVGSPIALQASITDVPAKPGLRTLWPIRANGEEANWRTSPEYLRELLTAGMAKLGAYDKKADRWSVLYLGKAQIERIRQGTLAVSGKAADGSLIVEVGEAGTTRTVKTVWNRSRHAAGEHGSRLLRSLIPGRAFTFPKSLYAVEDCLKVAVAGKPEAVIVDFFAGSGTTGHATMRLNHADGGKRQAILVTNNEVSEDEHARLRRDGRRPGDEAWESLGIARHVTKPRLLAALTGVRPDGQPVSGSYRFTDEFPMAEGMNENLEFFDLTYETPWRVARHRAFDAVAPLLWLRAGSEGRRIESLPDGWDVAEVYGVLEDLDQTAAFLKAVADSETVRVAFVVTDDDRRFQMVCDGLPDRVEPVRLYESYLRNFEIVGRD